VTIKPACVSTSAEQKLVFIYDVHIYRWGDKMFHAFNITRAIREVSSVTSLADSILEGVKKILSDINVLPSETLAIGDSPADRQVFEFAGTSIAINPKGGVEEFANYAIDGDLRKAIKFIDRLL